MQIEVDVKCIQTNFGGHGHSGFRDFACLHEWPNFEFPFWKFPIISKICFIVRWTLGDCKLEFHLALLKGYPCGSVYICAILASKQLVNRISGKNLFLYMYNTKNFGNYCISPCCSVNILLYFM